MQVSDAGLADSGLADSGLADSGLADSGLADSASGAAGAVASTCPVFEGHEPFPSESAPTAAACCYAITPSGCPGGRALVIDGTSRVAEPVRRTDWKSPACPRVPTHPALRDALANAWLADAQAEHASIASFARLSLDLLAMAAPPELIAASQQASLDEIDHARVCFAFASNHSGVPRGPGKLALGPLRGAQSIAELTDRTIEEGCVGETIAALALAEQARSARDPELARALSRMAEDEARHAELAWQIVRWAIESGGSAARAAAQAAFARAAPPAELRELPIATDPEWRAHGRLGDLEQRRLMREAHLHVIAPCTRALLNTPSPNTRTRTRAARRSRTIVRDAEG